MKVIPSDSLVEVVIAVGEQQYTVRRYDEAGNMYRDARFYYKIWQGGQEVDESIAPPGLVRRAREVLGDRWKEFCRANPAGRYQLDKSW